MVTILSTLGRLDFYNQIGLKSMSTLHVQLLCDILLDIVMVFIYLCSHSNNNNYCNHSIEIQIINCIVSIQRDRSYSTGQSIVW